jgi:hypothetical protein
MARENQSGDMAAAARRFYRLAAGVEVATFTVQKDQALDVQYELARNTPVDVGTARSNWRIAIGRPHTGRIKAYVPYVSRHRRPYGPGGSKSERANLNRVLEQGKARLAKYTKGSIYITNNVPYIGPLDRGHSKQAKPGWVTRAIYAAVNRTKPKIKPTFKKAFSK